MEDYKNETYKIMMSKFNRLNEQYNQKNKTLYNNILDSDIDNMLNFNEQNVSQMINDIINEIDIIHKNIDTLNKKINEYNGYKKDCEETINFLTKFFKSHTNLISKIERYPNLQNDLSLDNGIKIELKLKLENLLENIIDHIENIESEIKKHNDKINIFKKFILKCINIDNKNYHNICTICLSNKINICLNSCGHTFCSSCVDKMNDKCGMCRSSIISKIKMFIECNDENYNNANDENQNDEVLAFEGFLVTPLWERLTSNSIEN